MKTGRKIETAFRILRTRGVSGVWAIAAAHLRRAARRAGHALRGRLFRWGLLHVSRAKRLRVLYVVNECEMSGGQTVRYRVFNLIEALAGQADASYTVLEDGVWLDDWQVARADLVVCMRVFDTPQLRLLQVLARRLGRPTVFDIDDLIFLPDYYENFCTSLAVDTEADRRMYADMFERFREAFLRCDYATASTPYIVSKMQPYKHAAAIRNGLNDAQLAIARAIGPGTADDDVRRICYMSGSKSHGVDFEQAEPALARILAEYDDVRLSVVGYLDEALSRRFPEKVERVPYMPWQELLRYCAGCTVNLAPLDVSSPFCHAKSELKYFEAALVGVPTVASPTDTFIRCIRSGENGLLAQTEEEWYTAVRSLLDDRTLYARIRAEARQDALLHYAPPAVAREALAVYRDILQNAGEKGESAAPDIEA